MEADWQAAAGASGTSGAGEDAPTGQSGTATPAGAQAGATTSSEPTLPRRFFASKDLNPDRVIREVGDLTEEVIQHLTTLNGSNVQISIDIQAEIPDGVPDDVQRIVSENCLTLKLPKNRFGFEPE